MLLPLQGEGNHGRGLVSHATRGEMEKPGRIRKGISRIIGDTGRVSLAFQGAPRIDEIASPPPGPLGIMRI